MRSGLLSEADQQSKPVNTARPEAANTVQRMVDYVVYKVTQSTLKDLSPPGEGTEGWWGGGSQCGDSGKRKNIPEATTLREM